MSDKSLQPGDAQTLKSIFLVIGGLVAIMFVCIWLGLALGV